VAKMKEYSRAYVAEALELALSKITIYQCKKCGHPREDGYCCQHCKDSDGRGDQEESHIDVAYYIL